MARLARAGRQTRRLYRHKTETQRKSRACGPFGTSSRRKLELRLETRQVMTNQTLKKWKRPCAITMRKRAGPCPSFSRSKQSRPPRWTIWTGLSSVQQHLAGRAAGPRPRTTTIQAATKTRTMMRRRGVAATTTAHTIGTAVAGTPKTTTAHTVAPAGDMPKSGVEAAGAADTPRTTTMGTMGARPCMRQPCRAPTAGITSNSPRTARPHVVTRTMTRAPQTAGSTSRVAGIEAGQEQAPRIIMRVGMQPSGVGIGKLNDL
ncbi:hypothetical protein BCR44DRAFT_1045790 [Catenaria anguillulae PL171]|uniref:Uncharacterized protein n=1 Tax=Catenaria anguillulae PL171 TaxID=765915 RepID=A0A1Y2H7P2_9FUNG|nr:hypothetical protein BCR44DRAFT_1045790 [Catenaria anguillulae PL171]